MFDFLVDIWNSIVFFFGFIHFYITHFWEFADDGFRLLLKYATYFMFWASAQAMMVAVEIFQEFLESFNYSENVASAWSAVPETPRAMLGFFRVPECINILISAVGTRFTLNFVPFFGR
jgi:hypothetical protein